MSDPAVPTASDPQRNERSPSGTPRWVKVFGVVALTLVVAFVVLQVTAVGGEHGPSRHSPEDDTEDRGRPADVTTGHTGPPPGVTHP